MRFISLTDVPYAACAATIGFFDGVHQGHRFLISRLAEYARRKDLASLLVTFDKHPREVMQSAYQPRLLTTFQEKCALLAQTEADYCVVLHFTPELAALSAQSFMEQTLKNKLRAEALWIGYDHRFGHNRNESFADYAAYGRKLQMDVLQAPAYSLDGTNVSSSAVRALLDAGETALAAKCLGRAYEITGRVVGGFRIGRELGYPTANLKVTNTQKLIPKSGVYAVRVRGIDTRSQSFGGMLNIGTRPTLDNSHETSIEVHVIDFDGDLYGDTLTLSFIRRLRDEKKFRAKAELIQRLQQDEQDIRHILAQNNYSER